jgi:hypothetical protein
MLSLNETQGELFKATRIELVHVYGLGHNKVDEFLKKNNIFDQKCDIIYKDTS